MSHLKIRLGVFFSNIEHIIVLLLPCTIPLMQLYTPSLSSLYSTCFVLSTKSALIVLLRSMAKIRIENTMHMQMFALLDYVNVTLVRLYFAILRYEIWDVKKKCIDVLFQFSNLKGPPFLISNPNKHKYQ